MPVKTSGPLSDAELINGPKSPDILKLSGAEDCDITRNETSGAFDYACHFLPSGSAATDMQNDFVRLVRLVEKATGVSAKVTAPVVTQTSEHRLVYVGKIAVEEDWTSLPSMPFRPSADRIYAFNYFTINHLNVRITSDPLPDYNPPNFTPTASTSSSQIDEVLKSGRYTQMPKAQRIGSSGSGLASIRVTNDTAYALNLDYEGASSRTLTIAAHNTETVQLPAGSFRVLGRVSAAGVLPFVGSEILGPGDNLAVNFFIR